MFPFSTSVFSHLYQEPILFSGSIQENIAYGWRPENGLLKFEDILNAARQANALEFIESFPQGFSTVVGQKGQSLSGKFIGETSSYGMVWSKSRDYKEGPLHPKKRKVLS